MRSSSRLLLVALGCAVPLVAACSGRVLESRDASVGAAGSGESSGAGGASAGTSPGGATSAGTSPGGAAGAGGAWPLAGAGGALREPEHHRAREIPCDHTRPSNAPGAPADLDTSWVTCQSHAECTEGENGRCLGNGHDGWHCTYDSCFVDSDCADSASAEPPVCGCEQGFRSDHNVCLSGNCRLDAECGEGGYCSPSLGSCGNYAKTVGYFCHTQADECTDDSDCDASSSPYGAYCAFTPEVGHWRCSTQQCAG
ncbi:MAG: hypothetical protein WDO74_25525 [Pseudomonadota bacterium]